MRRTIKTKLAATFGLVFVLWGVSTGLAVTYLGDANERYATTVGRDLPRIVEIDELTATKINVRSDVGRVLIGLPNAPADYVSKLIEQVKQGAARVDELILELRGQTESPEILALIDKFDAIHKEAFALQMRIIETDQAGNGDLANTLYHTEGQLIADRIDASLEALRFAVTQRVSENSAVTRDEYITARNVIIGLFVVSALVVLRHRGFSVRTVAGIRAVLRSAILRNRRRSEQDARMVQQ